MSTVTPPRLRESNLKSLENKFWKFHRERVNKDSIAIAIVETFFRSGQQKTKVWNLIEIDDSCEQCDQISQSETHFKSKWRSQAFICVLHRKLAHYKIWSIVACLKRISLPRKHTSVNASLVMFIKLTVILWLSVEKVRWNLFTNCKTQSQLLREVLEFSLNDSLGNIGLVNLAMFDYR